MTLQLSFLSAVAIAGLAYLPAEVLDRRYAALRRFHVPAPLLGGLGAALVLFGLRAAGLRVEVPSSGREVDFLVAVLTTNMGLHVSARVLRQGIGPFVLFLGLGVVTFFVQLALVAPVALLDAHPLRSALLLGPLTHLGVPYNLNPPSQLQPIDHLFQPGFPQFRETARGIMMLGILAGAVAAAVVSPRLVGRANQDAPQDPPTETEIDTDVWHFTVRQNAVLTLVLSLIATAFGLQQLLLRWVPGFQDGYLPVIVISYLLGVLFRLAYEHFFPDTFPKQALNTLLYGPIMGLVLTYAVLSIPLHTLQLLTWPAVAGGLLAVGGSLLVAWAGFSLFRRLVDGYYAAVIATVFLAVTTGFGPVAMSFLRRFAEENGPGRPVPVVLPLNAFFLFPWLVSLLTLLLLRNAG